MMKPCNIKRSTRRQAFRKKVSAFVANHTKGGKYRKPNYRSKR